MQPITAVYHSISLGTVREGSDRMLHFVEIKVVFHVYQALPRFAYHHLVPEHRDGDIHPQRIGIHSWAGCQGGKRGSRHKFNGLGKARLSSTFDGRATWKHVSPGKT